MRGILYQKAKKKAISLMDPCYDPFHDVQHALEVEKTAEKIYESLGPKTRKRINLELIKLACLYHDTSRRVIKTNLLLQPFLDGYFSANIAYKSLVEVGYSKRQAERVKDIINSHESLLGILTKKLSMVSAVFSDADIFEGYSVERLKRGLRRFERKYFPKTLANQYAFFLTYMQKNKTPKLYFKFSQKMRDRKFKELQKYLQENKKRLRKLLYRPIFNYLYTTAEES